jgi:hypothetical protein
MPLLSRPSSSFPLTTSLPPPPRKRLRGRPNPPRPPLLLRKRLARPKKRRSSLPSRPNARHMPSHSLMISICPCLVAVSRPRRLSSGATAFLPPLVGPDGIGGSSDSTPPLTVANVCIRRSREGVHTTSIELATKILDSNGKSLYVPATGDEGMILIACFRQRAHSKHLVA